MIWKKQKSLAFLIFINLLLTSLAFRRNEQCLDLSNAGNLFSFSPIEKVRVLEATSKVYFLMEKALIRTDLNRLDLTYSKDFISIYPEDIYLGFEPTKYMFYNSVLDNQGLEDITYPQGYYEYKWGVKNIQVRGPDFENVYAENIDGTQMFVKSKGKMNTMGNWFSIPPSPKSRAFYTPKFQNSPGDGKPCVFRAYEGKLSMWTESSTNTLSSLSDKPVDFEITQIMDNPGTGSIILQGNSGGLLKICLYIPSSDSITNCFEPGLQYRPAPFYTGYYTYYVSSQGPGVRTYSRVRRADLTASSGGYYIENDSEIKFDEDHLPEDPHVVPLVATDRVIIFSDKQTIQKEYKFMQAKDIVPFKGVDSNIFLLYSDREIAFRFQAEPSLTKIATFAADIKLVETLPQSRYFVVFFDSNFVIRHLDSGRQSSEIPHSIPDFSTFTMSTSFFSNSKEFIYRTSTGFDLINYENIDQILKHSESVDGITALTVLNNENYIAVSRTQGSTYTIEILNIEDFCTKKTIAVSENVLSIKSSNKVLVPHINFIYYLTDKSIVTLVWDGNDDLICSSYHHFNPAVTFKNFEINPSLQEIAIELSQFSYKDVLIYNLKEDGTIGLQTTKKVSTGTGVSYKLVNTGVNILVKYFKPNKQITIFNLNIRCFNYFESPHKFTIISDNFQNLACGPVCSGSSKYDILKEKCVDACPLGTGPTVKPAGASSGPSVLTGLGDQTKVCNPYRHCDADNMIANCEIGYGPKCIKCKSSYYITSLLTVDDSCTLCNSPNIKPNPDLTTGYGKCTLIDVEQCQFYCGNKCLKCVGPLFRVQSADGLSSTCGYCENGLRPEFPKYDGTDICLSTQPAENLCKSAFGGTCTESCPGSIIIDANKNNLFESAGSCSELEYSFEAQPAKSAQSYCYQAQATNLIENCRTLNSNGMGCKECESGSYKASTFMKPLKNYIEGCQLTTGTSSVNLDVYYDSCSCCIEYGQSLITKSGINICLQCDKVFGFACKTCSESQCLSCISGYYLFMDDHKCCTSCDMSDFEVNGNFCKPKTCTPPCKTCFGNADNQCLTCDTASATNSRLLSRTTSCVASCPSNTYEDNFICRDCHSDCLTCGGITSKDCLTCSSDRYEDCFECIPCHDSCLTCSGPNNNDCLSCDTSSPTYGKFNSVDNTCVASCPSNTFEDFNICRACHKTCLTCSGPNSNDCLTCSDRFLVCFECKTCHDSCLTCDGHLSNNCLTCDTLCGIDEKYVLADKTCLGSCPSNTFDDSNTCRACHDDCLTCSGPNNDDCLSCDTSSPTHGKFNSVDNTCVASCPSNTFDDFNICRACHQTCLTCSGPNSNDCLTCSDLFFDCFECKTCHDSCLTCDGPHANNCLTCDTLCGINEKFVPADRTCLDSCPSNTFDDSNICRACHHDCLTCGGGEF